MKVVTITELRKMPVGTVFSTVWKKEYLALRNNLQVICDKTEPDEFCAVLDVAPFYQDHMDIDIKPGRDYPSEFSSTDTHDYDFDADQEFIVYSKAEVMGMIRVLLFALADGKVDNMAWSSVAGGDSLREDIG